MVKRWIPLESNPEVLNEFTSKLGLDTSKYSFTDVYGLDEELLSMVPQPCLAVLMLFPVTADSERAKAQEEEQLRSQSYQPPQDLFFMRQTIGNACGTIGALHAIGNLPGHPQMQSGSFLETFLQQTQGMSPVDRGNFLEHPPEDGPSIDSAHEEAARGGVTAAPTPEQSVDLHFICLTHHNSKLWELDGRKPFPIDHGPSSQATILQDAAKVVRHFIEASNSLNFNLIALTGS